MCGRITCYSAPEDLSCSCKYRDATDNNDDPSEISWVPEKFQNLKYAPSYNMGPRDTVVCIVAGSHFGENKRERVLCPMMWGMIPPWYKGEFKKHTASTHNGRLENLDSSKLYGKPLNRGNRCAIVVNGFYEWKTSTTNDKSAKKQPYYMFKKKSDDDAHNEHLKLAGLFDKWTNDENKNIQIILIHRSKQGETIYSCTIITTAANKVLSWLHHRAPVVLQTEEDIQDWLNYKKVPVDRALAKLRGIILSPSALQWHPVAITVNNVRNKDKSCVEPFAVGKDEQKSKKTPSGNSMMSAWLKTGSTKNAKRKSTEDDEQHESEKRTKALKKD